MDASIVIPTYNKLPYLQVALRSLESLEYHRVSFEVVVVDDGSGDDTAAFLSDVRCSFPLHFLRHESNRGRASARNTGLRKARGKMVIFLDDDMEVVPEFLGAHLRGHKEGSGRVVLGNVRSAPGVTRTALVRYLDSRGVHRLRPGQPVPFWYFATGNVSLERDLLLDVGLFDERFREFGGEDLELGYRLNRAGASFIYAPQAISLRRDYRDVRQLCKAMETYGQHSLPILLERHPELEGLLKVDLLKPMVPSSGGMAMTIQKLLLRMALWRGWGKFLDALGEVGNRVFIPTVLFDYLILFHRLNGFRRWERNPTREFTPTR